MCKYCDNARLHKKLLNTGIDGDGVYLGCSKSIMPESDRFECCPKCGAPLGEVKPLTVEQLRQMNGKPVFLKHKDKSWIHSGWRIIGWHESCISVCECRNECSRWISLDNYLVDWFTFDQEPKGETE